MIVGEGAQPARGHEGVPQGVGAYVSVHVGVHTSGYMYGCIPMKQLIELEDSSFQAFNQISTSFFKN